MGAEGEEAEGKGPAGPEVEQQQRQGKDAGGAQEAGMERKEKEKEEGQANGVRGVSSSLARTSSLDDAQLGMKKSSSYVRADLLNLKDLDAALERHMPRAASSGNLSMSDANRKRKVWEIDPSKLILKNVIAQGTYGTVHRGTYDGADVAVKLLDWGEEDTMTRAQIQTFRTAFKQEVEVWHKCDHPNVTRFIGASMGSSNQQIPSFQSGSDGMVHVASNICCVVVEYLAGGTLKDYLIKNRRRKLAFKVVHQLALDLARGLEYLHSKKIVHRDVKSENMLLDTKRTVKIADFGVARVEAGNPKDMTGETGTLGYMAPEVLDGKPYGHKCDVYSFGICLWEVYCCDMPYPDLSFTEMTYAVVHQNLRPTIPRCCPTALGQVMKKCWDHNPDKRPEMSQVVQMIEAIDNSKGGGMIPPDQPRSCFPCMHYRGP